MELALLLTATMVLMPALVLFARVFYQYSIVKQASQDAVSYMAALPVAAIVDDNAASAAVVLAQAMVTAAANESKLLDASTLTSATITCNGETCGGGLVPATIQSTVTLQVTDLGMSGATGRWTNLSTRKFRLVIVASVPYRN